METDVFEFNGKKYVYLRGVEEAAVDMMGAFQRKMDRYFIYGKPEVTERRELSRTFERSLKYAFIRVGHTRFLAYVDNFNQTRAFKISEGYERTWMEWKQFTFLRWARTMDL